MVWHDGPDFGELIRLWEADPAMVEGMLRQGLSERDALAAEAVGELPLPAESRASFVTALSDGIATSAGDFRTSAAQALHRLTGDESWSAEVAAVLQGVEHWGTKLDAARALASFTPTPELIAAAQAGVVDPDYLVRYHSANTLLRFAGLTDDISKHNEFFGMIVTDSDSSQWRLAAAALGALATTQLG